MKTESQQVPNSNGNTKVDAMDAIVARITALEKENEILRRVADQGQLMREDEKKNVGKPRQQEIHLGLINGKPIIGLRSVTNDVYTDERSGRRVADQVLEVTFHGQKEKKQYDLATFAKILTRTPKLIVKHTQYHTEQDLLGRTISYPESFTVEYEGQELTVESPYVNL